MRVQLASPLAGGAGAATAADAAGGVHGPVLRAHFVQICVVAMHQNGRDTHIRQVRLLWGDFLHAHVLKYDAFCEAGRREGGGVLTC